MAFDKYQYGLRATTGIIGHISSEMGQEKIIL